MMLKNNNTQERHKNIYVTQTTLDGADQKWFSVLPIELKFDWKRSTQKLSKVVDSERNRKYQRVICNRIRRFPNETVKQLAMRI